MISFSYILSIVHCTPAYGLTVLVAFSFLGLVVVYNVLNRFIYNFRVKTAGGVHATPLATNSITALPWMYRIGSAQLNNRMLEFYRFALGKAKPVLPHCVEINVTGAQRFIFTDQPEHIKTILTGKFADYGKEEGEVEGLVLPRSVTH